LTLAAASSTPSAIACVSESASTRGTSAGGLNRDGLPVFEDASLLEAVIGFGAVRRACRDDLRG